MSGASPSPSPSCLVLLLLLVCVFYHLAYMCLDLDPANLFPYTRTCEHTRTHTRRPFTDNLHFLSDTVGVFPARLPSIGRRTPEILMERNHLNTVVTMDEVHHLLSSPEAAALVYAVPEILMHQDTVKANLTLLRELLTGPTDDPDVARATRRRIVRSHPKVLISNRLQKIGKFLELEVGMSPAHRALFLTEYPALLLQNPETLRPLVLFVRHLGIDTADPRCHGLYAFPRALQRVQETVSYLEHIYGTEVAHSDPSLWVYNLEMRIKVLFTRHV